MYVTKFRVSCKYFHQQNLRIDIVIDPNLLAKSSKFVSEDINFANLIQLIFQSSLSTTVFKNLPSALLSYASSKIYVLFNFQIIINRSNKNSFQSLTSRILKNITITINDIILKKERKKERNCIA